MPQSSHPHSERPCGSVPTLLFWWVYFSATVSAMPFGRDARLHQRARASLTAFSTAIAPSTTATRTSLISRFASPLNTVSLATCLDYLMTLRTLRVATHSNNLGMIAAKRANKTGLAAHGLDRSL
jgi:hypothetical protein